MSTVKADYLVNAAGTGAPSFPNGLSVASPALTGTPTAPTATVGTNTTQIATTAFVAASQAAGEVSFFAMSSAPTGWIKANGAAISRTTYATLFTAIGTTFGVGDGSTTFNVPDLRGEFARGWDDGRGIDSGRAFGSAQTGQNESHTHFVAKNTNGTNASSSDLTTTGAAAWGTGSGSLYEGYNLRNTNAGAANVGPTNSSGGTEARPRNIALLACIRY
jgi:microcystin-dependent protein